MSCEVFSLTILLLESPEKRSIAIAPAVQFKKFYRTCSAMGVFLISRLVGLSTSDRILTSYQKSEVFLSKRRFIGKSELSIIGGYRQVERGRMSGMEG